MHKAEDNSTNDTRNGNPSYLTLYDQGLATTIGNTEMQVEMSSIL